MVKPRTSGSVTFANNLVTLLLVLACVLSLYLVGSAIFGAVNGGQEVTAHQEVTSETLRALPPSVVVHSQYIPVTIRIQDAQPHQLFAATTRDLLIVMLGLGILWLVRGLLMSVREGDPFMARNVHRLRAIGFILVLGFPLSGLIVQFLDRWLAASSSVGELGSTFPPSMFGGLFVGLGVFVLAEVFAHGVRLREDVEGTV